eukprot:764400-Prymnesium_polylepis.1
MAVWGDSFFNGMSCTRALHMRVQRCAAGVARDPYVWNPLVRGRQAGERAERFVGTRIFDSAARCRDLGVSESGVCME